MKGMTPEAIAKACNGTYFGPEEAKNIEITGVAIDSRKVEKGFLFIPIKGQRVDGHDFIDQVLAKGASLTLSEKELPGNKTYILVKSTKEAIRALAKYYLDVLDVKVVGITGSVGKTSTKEMIASVLSQKFNVHKTKGNFNNEIGLPLTVFELTNYHDIAVLEMGISHFGDMDMLAEIARPDICVITNIAECHLENLGDRNGVLKAKTEVFKYMNSDAVVVLNGDDDLLRGVKEVNGKAPIFFGIENYNDIVALDIQNKGIEGTTCKIRTKEAGEFDAVINIPGKHMVYNALAATAVGKALGLSNEEIKAGLSSAATIAGRCNIVHKGNITLIDDCYNANPQSMQAALDLVSMVDGRKIAILGDMFELGPDELELHYNIGKYAVEKGIDYVVCVGERSEYMYKGALNAIEMLDSKAPNCLCKSIHVPSLDSMPDLMRSLLESGDTVLIKASHAMGFDAIPNMI